VTNRARRVREKIVVLVHELLGREHRRSDLAVERAVVRVEYIHSVVRPLNDNEYVYVLEEVAADCEAEAEAKRDEMDPAELGE